MTNSTNTPATSKKSTAKRTSGLRRTIAGLAAAATIAFGGTTLLTAQEAQAAGVQATNYTNTYAVTTDAVKVVAPTTLRTA